MLTYDEAKKQLEAGRNKTDRPLANNTRLQLQADGNIVIRLHSTNIITLQADGGIRLNSGGWRTVTTKERLNRYLTPEFRIWTEKGVWYIGKRGNDTRYLFADHMQLSADGLVIAEIHLPAAGKEQRKLLRTMSKYSNDFIDQLFAGKVGPPTLGDCWYCLLRKTEPGEGTTQIGVLQEDGRLIKTGTVKPGLDGPTMGELQNDTNHLLSHFEEPYYVPSLLVRAIERHPVSLIAKHELSCKWYPDNPQAESIGGSMLELAKDQLRKSLYRYLKGAFGFQA